MNHCYDFIKVCILLLYPFYGYGQKDQSDRLEHLRHEVARIEKRIQNEMDTLKSLKTQLEILEDQNLALKFGVGGDDMSLPITLKMNGKIRKSSDPISDVIKFVSKKDTVWLKGYQDNYWIVSSGEFYGYLSEIYVYETKDVLLFKNALIRQAKVQGSSSQRIRESDVGQSSGNGHGTYTNTYQGSSSHRVIHTGPRGGRYYINSNGNKTYIKR